MFVHPIVMIFKLPTASQCWQNVHFVHFVQLNWTQNATSLQKYFFFIIDKKEADVLINQNNDTQHESDFVKYWKCFSKFSDKTNYVSNGICFWRRSNEIESYLVSHQNIHEATNQMANTHILLKLNISPWIVCYNYCYSASILNWANR